MIFRQLFDTTSGTYTYLLASRHGGEALIIDPVLERVDRYLQLVRELDLRLVKAVDTHLHADHAVSYTHLDVYKRQILVVWSARPIQPLMRMLVRPHGERPASKAERSPVARRIIG